MSNVSICLNYQLRGDTPLSSAPAPADKTASDQLALRRSQSLTSIVQTEIERLILQGELAPDTRINELGLATQLGVSRGPVREACRTLQASGLIESKPNRGFFVRLLTTEEAIEAYHTRAAIIAYAGMTLAPIITQSQLETLRDLLDKMDAVVSRGEVETYDPINLEFHDSILQMAGNERLRQTYHDLLREQHMFRHRGLSHGDNLLVSNREHRLIVDSLAKGDAASAFNSMRDHVLHGMQRMLKADSQ